MALQAGGALPTTPWELVKSSSAATLIVLGVIGFFSLFSWFLIVLKWWQFRRVRRQGDRLFAELERTATLQDAFHTAMKLPPSPYARLLRESVNFFADLNRPARGAEAAPERPSGVFSRSGTALTGTQVEVLRMVFAKEIAAERDVMARFIPWLATIGSVSPLLGLLGTVLGVMDAFIGIATRGSGNISAVAPGVAEALITTVAGLAVAIPAVIAYNIFVSRLSVYAGELEGFAYEIVGTMAREGRL
jgi:biopolymer transport protein TolQ